MIKNRKLLLIILMVVLIILIPNIVKAVEEKVIKSINITIPEQVLGEKPANSKQISVKANGDIHDNGSVIRDINTNLEIEQVQWKCVEENSTGDKEEIVSGTDVFKKEYKYKISIIYRLPNEYVKSDNIIPTVNGQVAQNNILIDENEEYKLYRLNCILGKAKGKINFNAEKVSVIVTETGEADKALPGKIIKLVAMKEANSWEVTVKGSSGNIETTKHDVEGELPYYTFTMPEENVEVIANYIGEKKKIEIIDIRIPDLIGGKEKYKAKDVIAVAREVENATINVTNIIWKKYNPETEKYEDDETNTFGKGQKYRAYIEVNVPEEYIYNDPIFKFNNNEGTLEGIRGIEGYCCFLIYFDFDSVKMIYNVLKGENEIYTVNKDKTIEIRVDANFEEFIAVYMDGKLVDKKNYEAKTGSTIIIFSEDYLKTLNSGEHTVKIAFKDNGEATAKLTINNEEKVTSVDKTKAPGTIPHAGGTFIIIVLAAVLIIVGIYAYRKNRDLNGV